MGAFRHTHAADGVLRGIRFDRSGRRCKESRAILASTNTRRGGAMVTAEVPGWKRRMEPIVGRPILAAAAFQAASGVSTFSCDFPPAHALYVGQALSPANSCYVLPQKASPLASRSHRGNVPVCHLAFGRLHPQACLPQPAAGAPRSAGRAFLVLDREVDKAAFGPVWLRDARVARVVAEALLHGQSGRHFYQLRAWV